MRATATYQLCNRILGAQIDDGGVVCSNRVQKVLHVNEVSALPPVM